MFLAKWQIAKFLHVLTVNNFLIVNLIFVNSQLSGYLDNVRKSWILLSDEDIDEVQRLD